jgi:hypothetical protein
VFTALATDDAMVNDFARYHTTDNNQGDYVIASMCDVIMSFFGIAPRYRGTDEGPGVKYWDPTSRLEFGWHRLLSTRPLLPERSPGY